MRFNSGYKIRGQRLQIDHDCVSAAFSLTCMYSTVVWPSFQAVPRAGINLARSPGSFHLCTDLCRSRGECLWHAPAVRGIESPRGDSLKTRSQRLRHTDEGTDQLHRVSRRRPSRRYISQPKPTVPKDGVPNDNAILSNRSGHLHWGVPSAAENTAR